ncbi:nucleotidyltransferase [Candidatus Bathyarchaeota archaeon ex4484_205]|nr:MAG: nucleotidyltransferase [Candidatus Bathyarchaeota archaeon ex4484_205]RLG68796.1 MAG: nucleotidyltransferase [archaeon]
MGKTVLTGGVFDILHPGHVKLLKKGKKLAGRGGKLIVVIARDETVIGRRGRRPVFNERYRKMLVENLKPVDEAVLGYKDVDKGLRKILERFKPDIILFGYDQNELRGKVGKIVKELNLKCRLIKAPRYKFTYGYSSSDVKRMVQASLR